MVELYDRAEHRLNCNIASVSDNVLALGSAYDFIEEETAICAAATDFSVDVSAPFAVLSGRC